MARAPNRSLLELLTPEAINAALTTGPMQQQAQGLDASQRQAIAEYLAGRPLGASPPVAVRRCAAQADWFDWRQPPSASGWGIDRENRDSSPPLPQVLALRRFPTLSWPGLSPTRG